ncbi:hypothetical protein RHGRI_012947 [Rhododendron griersonianum]|uniref:LAGLIDADG homing endonuclease n=1 Tax=Rhododendron griersonianum TaxID=479676 RepID=A0AAV6K409_9ERIC|nr:hypothetical protein RHGRI_012947 [Rhododendron griersonianum]
MVLHVPYKPDPTHSPGNFSSITGGNLGFSSVSPSSRSRSMESTGSNSRNLLKNQSPRLVDSGDSGSGKGGTLGGVFVFTPEIWACYYLKKTYNVNFRFLDARIYNQNIITMVTKTATNDTQVSNIAKVLKFLRKETKSST